MASSKIVQLNIGGKTFATSADTLLSSGESFFTSLLKGSLDTTRDLHGAYFIDRSPRYFEPILHFLRTGDLVSLPGSMLITLPGASGADNRKSLAVLSPDASELCVTAFSCGQGGAKFNCSHDNPHHFHRYIFKRF